MHFFDFLDRHLTVLGFAANLEIRVSLDPRSQRRPNPGVVIDDENGVLHAPAQSALGRLAEPCLQLDGVNEEG
jgi:hypothetical protein